MSGFRIKPTHQLLKDPVEQQPPIIRTPSILKSLFDKDDDKKQSATSTTQPSAVNRPTSGSSVGMAMRSTMNGLPDTY
jgi:hypothetical protein